ncbi:MAG: ATP-binding cassette domain-containing protein [Anaerolineae bacterium]
MFRRKGYDLPSFSWDDSRPLIEMREIFKSFKTTAGDVPVLKTISVDIYRNQFVSVVGRSGSGKSTLVNMLTGIDHPTRGSVRVADKLIHHLSESEMSGWRGRHLGIVFQFFQLLPMLSLLENVMLPMDFCNLYPPAEREDRALALLTQVGLKQFIHKMPGAIAGGQQQSVAIARALANDPPILIADEPTGNLDGRTAEQVIELFEEQVSLGKTVVMVTHDRDLARHARRMLVIVDGELIPETLSQAFPQMRHRDLIALSHRALSQAGPAGQVIPCPPEGDDHLFMVTQGEIHIYRSGAGLAGIYKAGEWFCSCALGGGEAAILKAGPAGVEYMEIPTEGIQIPAQPGRRG